MRWQVVGRTDEIPAGQLQPAEAGSLPIVVWRGASGRVCAMDARCPHQWSDLGSEGSVQDDELVCSAHLWRFDQTGRGRKVNIKGRSDEKADIAVFECRERNGLIEVRVEPEPG